MKRSIALLCLLASCGTPQQSAQTQQTIAVMCANDQVFQPLAVAIATASGPQGQAVATTDSLLVHPVVVASCAAFNAHPVAAAPVVAGSQ